MCKGSVEGFVDAVELVGKADIEGAAVEVVKVVVLVCVSADACKPVLSSKNIYLNW